MCKKFQCIKCNWCSDATVFMSTSLGVQWTLKLLVAGSYHRGLNHTRHLPLMHIFLVPALQGVPSITMSLIITEKNLFSGLQCNWQGVSAAKKKKNHDVVTKPKVKCLRWTIICLELYKKYLARFKPIFLESAKQNCNFCKGYHLSCKTLSWHVIQ